MARKVGSGGKHKRALRGRGNTPKAEDRVYHKAYKARKNGQGKPQQNRKPSSTGRGAGADWVVGRNPVLEAMKAGLPVKAAYVAEGSDRDNRLADIFKYAAENSITLLQTTRGELDRLTGGSVHQGVAMQLPSYEYADAQDLMADALYDDDKQALVVMLDGITDPHNLGAIVRSAAAFNAHGVVIPDRRSASMTAVAWKSSAGAAARIPVAKTTNINRAIDQYKKAGYTVVGLAGGGEADIAATPGLDGPLVIVVGSEGAGISRLTQEKCDVLASIPISNSVESLNASVAAAIALYEVSRVRG